jgi:NADH:ubiquinone oxidoreductase subunit 5 (subunit L)/multisubunit Na+/H+ antiporter MnhA subunit
VPRAGAARHQEGARVLDLLAARVHGRGARRGLAFAGFFHLGTHAFFKALLFLAAGSVIHAVHSNELDDMGGLRKKMPITGAAFVIGALSLAGVPGFAGFFSKDLVLSTARGQGGLDAVGAADGRRPSSRRSTWAAWCARPSSGAPS